MSGPKAEQWEANLMQMKINTRLTALQTALEIMKTSGYTGIPGQTKAEEGKLPEPIWVKPPGAVDHITLLAMAGDIRDWIINDLAEEAQKAIDAAKNPNPNRILQVR